MLARSDYLFIEGFSYESTQLKLKTYDIYPIGRTKGIVEFIPGCVPIEEIKNKQIDQNKNPREALIDHFQSLCSKNQ
eukprot:UN22464